ncbi:MAG: hypothetical protein ABI615_11965, partial [Chthoniobacterales bacterium]
VDGQILQGDTSAAISGDEVQGILFGAGTTIPTDADGTVTLPIAFIVPGNAASGEFHGKIDLISSIGSTSGNGVLTGAPARVDQLIVIIDPSLSDAFVPPPAVTTTPIAIPGSTLATTKFTFRGTRNSTTSLAAASPTPSP